MNTQCDFLIIGMGLAGGLLAWELIRRGKRVIVADAGNVNASQVAAGLINPLTGPRLAKMPNIDRLLPEANEVYRQLAEQFKQPFFIQMPMHRMFRNDREAEDGAKRHSERVFRPYLGAIHRFDAESPHQGYLEQKQTGYLEARPLLTHLKAFLIVQGAYRQDFIDYRDFRANAEPEWKGIKPRQIIACEGFAMCRNPWLSWLPMQPVKGEILTLAHRLTIPDRIVNDGYWLIPTGEREVRVGATFERDALDTLPTEKAERVLRAAGKRFYAGLDAADLSAHAAGIRPCTPDRQPFIGRHPRIAWLHVFNGFGSKGCLAIPWHARRFADFLLQDEPLPDSVDIRRYESTHFPA